MPDQTDAKNILTAFPYGELEETTGTLSYYVDEDIHQNLKFNNLSLNEVTWLRIIHSGD